MADMRKTLIVISAMAVDGNRTIGIRTEGILLAIS